MVTNPAALNASLCAGLSASGEGDESPNLSSCPLPAPDRHEAPAPRKSWTPREIAVYLLGASAHSIARTRDLELRQITGELVRRWVLVDLRDGQAIPCASASAVVRAVEGLVLS